MRARLALQVAHVKVDLREIVLRDKPDAFLQASPSGTVPCLVLQDAVIDESLDIMIWALKQRDPNQWLRMPETGWKLIEVCDGPFKHALDRTKYTTRYPEDDPDEARDTASAFLDTLEQHLHEYLFDQPTVADAAILPFVRQFAFIDKAWFDAQPWPKVQRWLEAFLQGDLFSSIMQKYPQWKPGDVTIVFPDGQPANQLAR